MVTTARVSEIGAALGEPARTAMLLALMDGRALTAGELAAIAGITPPTASAHLAKLMEAGLLAVEKQGRHRYHRLTGQEVAGLLEGLMQLAGGSLRPSPRTGPKDAALRRARTCYDHLAGQLGTAIHDALVSSGAIALTEDGASLTGEGAARLAQAGIVLPPPRGRQPVCRLCLDWSERRHHLAGRLGAAICGHAQGQGWIRRETGSRAVTITPKGRRAFPELLGVALPA